MRIAEGRLVPVAALLLSLCGVAPPLLAQRLPASEETIDVSLVNVDVFVTDKKGRRVTGLAPEDFEILQNGKLQPITNFAEYGGEAKVVTVDAKPGAARDVTPAPAAKRTIVVFVERFSLPAFRTKPMFDAMRKTLRDVVRPGDSAAVIFWDDSSAFTLQDFTDDLPSLEAALKEIEQQSTGVTGSVDYIRKRADFANAYFASLPPERAGVRTAAESVSRWDLQSNALFGLTRIKLKSTELQAIMRSIADEDGRKIVLFATNDFGLFPRGAEATGGQSPISSSDWRTDRYRNAVARTANEHGITVYPIYPGGLGWQPMNGAWETRSDIFRIDFNADANRAAHDANTLINQTAALDELAKATGGLMASGSMDVVELLPHIAEDLSNYYSLAYRTPATGTTNSRDIVVRVKNRDYQVRSRREYVEKTDATRMRDRVIANLYRPDRRGAIPVTVDLGAVEKISRTRWSVPLRIHVPTEALSTVGGNEGAFSVFIATGGVIGIMSDVERRTQSFTVADLQGGLKEFTYDFTLTFDAATSVVSIGVMDERTKDYGLKTLELPTYGKERLGASE